MPSYRYAYFHGFGSSPKAHKGLELRTRYKSRDVDLWLPDLNRPSFGRLSQRAMLRYLEEVDGGKGPTWRIIGSSLGGWLAAAFAEKHPDRVDALVLLCPGFGLAKRWGTIMGPEAMKEWGEKGELPIPNGAGELIPVHFGFFLEAQEMPPAPRVSCPTLIIHGSRDETVPAESSRRYAGPRAHIRLIEVDDDHSLHASIDVIDMESWRHFERTSS